MGRNFPVDYFEDLELDDIDEEIFEEAFSLSSAADFISKNLGKAGNLVKSGFYSIPIFWFIWLFPAILSIFYFTVICSRSTPFFRTLDLTNYTLQIKSVRKLVIFFISCITDISNAITGP